jgi:sulfate adenylyltransferase subunit 1 (EFTu-like GTPase family)
VTWDGDLEMAHAPMSVTLTLEDEIDISRGDVLAADSQPAALSYPPSVEKRFEAEMVWMDQRPLDPARVYLLKQGTRVVSAEVNRGLILNQIGTVTITATRPLVFDRYADNRTTGSFILIDPATNFTAGAGMITAAVHERAVSHARPSAAERLAQIARGAATDEEAVELVRLALEDILK